MSRLGSPRALLTTVTASHAVHHMYQGALPILYPAILKELGLTYTQLGLVIAAHSLTLGFLQFGASVAGRYMSKRILLGVGNIVLGIGNLAVGLSGSFLTFLLGRVLAGVGGSPQHPVATSLIAERFKEQARGFALGAHFGLAFIGNILGPLTATAILTYAEWRSTLYILTVPAVAMGVFVMLLIREEPSKASRKPLASVQLDIRRALTDRDVVMLLSAQLLISGAGQGILMNYTPVILADMFKMDSYRTAVFFMTLLIGGSIGPVAVGRLSDILGRRIVGLLTILSTSLFLYLFVNLSDPGVTLAVTLALLGVSAFTAPVIIQAALSDITPPSLREIVFGVYYTSTFPMSAIWGMAVGYFADVQQTFTPILTASAVFNASATIFILLGGRGRAARGVEDL